MTNAKSHPKAGDVFEADIELDTRDPKARAFFEKEYAKARAIGALLAQLEAARERKHLSQAEVARRMNRQESAVSRLLKGGDANPRFDTIADLAFAHDLELEVRIKDRAPGSKKPQMPVRILAPIDA